MTDLPQTLPVMVLPGCSLFPGARMPLYIFEPRYREMLADALAGERMFCVGTVDEAEEPPTEEPAVYPFSTAGLVRACVTNDDGTSHLVLEGLQRVRFTAWEEGKPYRVARVEAIGAVDGDPEESRLLCEQIKDLAEKRLQASGAVLEGGTADDLWASLGSGEAIADFVAYHMIPDVELRQPLLAMRNVEERLAFVRECLLR